MLGLVSATYSRRLLSHSLLAMVFVLFHINPTMARSASDELYILAHIMFQRVLFRKSSFICQFLHFSVRFFQRPDDGSL